jgi:hypothetical protein
MILSNKDLKVLTQGIELLLKAHQDRFHIAEGINEEETIESGELIVYLKLLLISLHNASGDSPTIVELSN